MGTIGEIQISDVKVNIIKRIKAHEKTISDALQFIGVDLSTDTVKRMTPLIQEEEQKIKELNEVLETCFKW